MTLGLGIFLSSLVFAPIILFALTKDRWNWHRIVAAILILSSLAGGAIFASKMISNIPSQQSQYAGLRLGMPMAEVRYAHGVPDAVLEETTEGAWKGDYLVIITKDIVKDKAIEDYDRWSYNQLGSRIDLSFDKAQNQLIAIQCYSEDEASRCPLIGGIRDGDSEDKLVAYFGNPAHSKIEGVSKTITYPAIGVFFHLTKQQVYSLGINDLRFNKLPI